MAKDKSVLWVCSKRLNARDIYNTSYAMFYLKCKIVRTCDFCDINPLKGFKINSR